MARNVKSMPEVAGRQLASIKKLTAVVNLDDFTDGGSTSGTADLEEAIPKGALVLGCAVEVTEGFAGDTSATLTIGDGTDVDRYNTGTPSVFAASTSVNMGAPSGARHHGAAVNPKLTVTSGTDFGGVTGGQMIVTIYYV